MCGIFAVVNDKNKNAAQTILEGLKKLEYRGYDSWGIAVKPLQGKSIKYEKHVGKIGEAKTTLPKSSLGIGHTRWATHGGVTNLNAHPHLDCTGRIAVIHNGIIENYQQIKKNLIKKGHRLLSETDTEVIAHLIEETLKSQSVEKAVFNSFNKLLGSNAISVLIFDKELIIACRKGSPLVVGIDDKNNQYFLGSDVPAFLKFTNNVYFLEDGEGVIISKNSIRVFYLRSKKEKKFKPQTVSWKVEEVEKSGYPHFLLKEISEQKETIGKTATINDKKIIQVANLIKKGYQPVFTGCGSAYYCSLGGKYFFAKSKVQSQAYSANEFIPFARLTNKNTLMIVISQSGETADTLISAKEAKKYGAKIVAVVNARGSTLERLADVTIPVSCGPEIAVVSTKAFTAQLATLYLLSEAVTGNLKKAQEEIKNISLVLKNWLNENLLKQLISLSKNLINEDNIYLIGKNFNYPAALEFALKLKETSYIHAEAFAAGELKHGVIALIKKNTLCFVLAANDEVKEEILSSAAEVKARGGKIIGVAPFDSNEFDQLVKTPDLGDLTILANIIVGQLLGYYLAVQKGYDPDKPRNLAKSVTVK